ncbi:MAG: 30S ribosomal protein S6 [Candidatus Babeliales bacterium]
MLRYEVLLLARPDITKDETSVLEKEFDSAIKKNKAKLVSFDRWGKYRLAYPVRNNAYGVYFLTRFEVEGQEYTQLLEDIRSFLRLKQSDVVMRDMVTKLDPEGSLEYQRPESLEETPQDVDSFLKANKMGGLVTKTKKPISKVSEDGEEDFLSDDDSE